LRFKSAVVLSFLLHLLIIFLLVRITVPPAEERQESPLIARIVSAPAVGKSRVPESKVKGLPLEKTAPEAAPPATKPAGRQTRPQTSTAGGASGKPTGPPVEPGRGAEPPGEGSEKGRLARELFDSGIIGDIAKLKPPPKGKSEITFSTKDLKYYNYMMKLKSRIERVWRYPPEAVRRGIYGDPYIRFTIKKDGYLGSVELIRTSGYRELDEAAIKALRDGEPYWPLPENWDVEGITITGHFVYTLYGTYLR